MTEINFILFDLGNVIIDVDKVKALRIFSEITGKSIEKLLDFTKSDLERDFEKGKITIDEYVIRLRSFLNLGEDIDKNMLIEIWSSCFNLNKHMIKLIKKINWSIKKGILSNTNPLHIEAIKKKYDSFVNFDYLFFSYDLGYVKPDERIYYAVLDKLNTKANAVLFIDDLKANLKPAKEMGFHTYLFDGANKLENYLSRIGVIN